jgi:hypothetical protein
MQKKPAYDDRVLIELSPADLSYLIYVCEKKFPQKSGCKDCVGGGVKNERIHCYLKGVLEEWRKQKK